MDTAKKKAELEKRLQDVSGQLSGTKSKSKKNAGESMSNSILGLLQFWYLYNNTIKNFNVSIEI